MKLLLITVAGSSTRFSKSLGRECIKCLYDGEGATKSLLYRMLQKARAFDKVIVVGGYRYEELVAGAKKSCGELAEKCVFVYNPEYAAYGSGYSLYLGLKECMKYPFDEIVFAEGDLYTDGESFEKVVDSEDSVITLNREHISSDKSVVLYVDAEDRIRYIYDTAHNLLEIKQPFKAVYNSGQIWKFKGKDSVAEAYGALTEKAWQGTNLVFVQRFFEGIGGAFRFITFKDWINCNTVQDFNRIPE